MSDDDKDGRDGDRLLHQLGQRERERRAQENGAGGGARLTAEEAALFAPWDVAAQDQLVAALQKQIAPAPTAGAEVGGRVVPLPLRRSRRSFVIAASGLLAAAGVALVFSGRGPGNALPAYALTLQGGDQAVRGGDAPPASDATVPTLQPDSSLEIRARPARPAAELTAAAFFATASSTRLTPLPGAPEMSPEGALRWRGTAAELFGAARGLLEVRVVIGRGLLPEAAEIAGQTPGSHGSWQLLVARVRIASAARP